MSLSDPLTSITIVLAVLVGLLIGTVTVLALRLRRLAADQHRALDGVGFDVISTLARSHRRLDELDVAIGAAREHSEMVEQQVRGTISRVGVVRYDAYDDIGGQLSFSAALLDGHSDGIVLTSITGRTGGRTYLKPVTAGVGDLPLSEEEIAAVASAQERARGDKVVEQGKRRWRQR